MPALPTFTPGPRRATRLLRRALLVALLWPLSMGACGTIDEDELACEEAVAKLQHCCPMALEIHVRCAHTEGCNSQGPEILPDESRALRSMECSEIVEGGLCRRYSSP